MGDLKRIKMVSDAKSFPRITSQNETFRFKTDGILQLTPPLRVQWKSNTPLKKFSVQLFQSNEFAGYVSSGTYIPNFDPASAIYSVTIPRDQFNRSSTHFIRLILEGMPWTCTKKTFTSFRFTILENM